jgi:hypothetical protein
VAITAPDEEFDYVSGDLATDGTFIYMDCFLDDLSVGICKFDTNGNLQLPILPNHVSNVNVIPGPRLGGLDIVYDHDRNIQVVVGADKHGVIMEMADLSDGSTLGGFVMPREFQVIRLASYPHDSNDN